MKRVLPELVLLLLPLSGCSRQPPAATLTAPTFDEAVSNLAGCLAADRTNQRPVAGQSTEPQLVITHLRREPARMTVGLAAWSRRGGSSLTLTLYTLSRGRWLLGAAERVYLIDQECRRYGLLDVRFPDRRHSPGTIKLAPGQVVEGELIFPPPGARARLGALVYGDRSIEIIFPPATLSPDPDTTAPPQDP